LVQVFEPITSHDFPLQHKAIGVDTIDDHRPDICGSLKF